MRCYYRERQYKCGDYLDVQIFPVFAKPGVRRCKAKPTSEIQKKLNDENAKKKLIRLIHTNFTSSDLALHLTYTDENLPSDADRAKKDVQNLLKKLKRRFEKIGKEFKYIWVCETGKRSSRIHHHLIISGGVSRDEIEALWKYGYANTKRLKFDENGLVGLSTYITKQQLLFKHWSASKNLKRPIEKVCDYKYTHTDVEDIVQSGDLTPFLIYYTDFGMSDFETSENALNGAYYISARFYKIQSANVFRRG